MTTWVYVCNACSVSVVGADPTVGSTDRVVRGDWTNDAGETTIGAVTIRRCRAVNGVHLLHGRRPLADTSADAYLIPGRVAFSGRGRHTTIAKAHELDCEAAAADCRFIRSENEEEAIELAQGHMKEVHGREHTDGELQEDACTSCEKRVQSAWSCVP